LVSRFLRLYPAAWCVLLICFSRMLFLRHYDSSWTFRRVFDSLTLLPGVSLATAYWTLPVEIAFYLVVFALIRSRRFDGGVSWFAILLILWSLPYNLAYSLCEHGILRRDWLDFGIDWRNMLLMRHGMYFALGMQIWLMKKGQLLRRDLLFGGLALFLAGLQIDARAGGLLHLFAPASDGSALSYAALTERSIGAFLVAFLMILLAVRMNHLFPRRQGLRRAVRNLGTVTYPLYLLHERIGFIALERMGRSGHTSALHICAAVLSALGVAFLVSTVGEPLLRRPLKRLLQEKPRTEAAVFAAT
jgi:peptidoglycan/LPS O-acetylase OafA/YrhL